MGRSDKRAYWLGRNVLPHEPSLRFWLTGRKLGSGIEVDDIIQETYSRLMAARTVDHIENVKGYLFQTATSVIIDHVRKMRVIPIETISEMEFENAPADVPSPEQHVVGRDEFVKLAAVIASFPGKVREVFTLRKVHGFSQREVAKELGITENTVEKRMGQATLLMIQHLAKRDQIAVQQRPESIALSVIDKNIP
jgi:RNA polymerase sigma-70 factor (ECF subfamily)